MVYFNPPLDLTEEEESQLYSFLSKQYISHEDYPAVINIVRKMMRRHDERQDSKTRS